MRGQFKPWRVESDRFEPGQWCVKNARGEVLARYFGTEEEAKAWKDEREAARG